MVSMCLRGYLGRSDTHKTVTRTRTSEIFIAGYHLNLGILGIMMLVKPQLLPLIRERDRGRLSEKAHKN